jgi:transcriptional regulator with XRE-family HTH domain
MKLSDRIFEERVRRRLSLRKFSKLLDVNYNSLWQYENGITVPTRLTERVISDKLNILEKEEV